MGPSKTACEGRGLSWSPLGPLCGLSQCLQSPRRVPRGPQERTSRHHAKLLQSQFGQGLIEPLLGPSWSPLGAPLGPICSPKRTSRGPTGKIERSTPSGLVGLQGHCRVEHGLLQGIAGPCAGFGAGYCMVLQGRCRGLFAGSWQGSLQGLCRDLCKVLQASL